MILVHSFEIFTAKNNVLGFINSPPVSSKLTYSFLFIKCLKRHIEGQKNTTTWLFSAAKTAKGSPAPAKEDGK